MNITNTLYLPVKQTMQWLVRHHFLILISLIVLLSAYIGFNFLITLIKENNVRNYEKQMYKAPVPTRIPVFFDTHPADSKLIAEVKKSTKILDTLYSGRGATYQLNILVDETVAFILVGVQFVDSSSALPITNARLTLRPPQPSGTCSVDSDRKKYYETEMLSESWIYSYAPINSTKRLVNLIVSVNGELFLVKGLEFSEKCFWATID